MPAISLHFDKAPTGIPLVLLPPFPLDSRMWRPVRDLLSDLPVIVADPPGFGDSLSPTAIAYRLGVSATPSLETHARGLADALDKLHVEKIVLAGVSIGGYVTMAFAELYPERLAGIGLLNTTAEADSDERRETRLRMAAAAESGAVPAIMLANLLQDVVSPVTLTERPELHRVLRAWYEQAPDVGIAWSQRAMAARPNRLGVLAALSIPALVLRGADDAVSFAADAEAMAAALGTNVVEIPRVGHMAAIEDPEPVAAALRDLWERATR